MGKTITIPRRQPRRPIDAAIAAGSLSAMMNPSVTTPSRSSAIRR
jgi:hypothetical protein